ncbi:peptidase M48 [Lampropedia puyangensis]|uniref:Peptidase M48 n=1 Tax=Lampropedia puyangensis TaxID=1330072 RepID=A0A4S8F090_9BURK|nr:M48 family metalloprotease [Lampropedia puyangensis]THT99393.1 peptidase M48 [Lampropedia puyangensis]
MGFRKQQQQARQTTWILRLGFWLMVPLVALSVHGMLSIPLWLAHWFFGVDGLPRGFFWANVGTAMFLMIGGWWLESSHLHQGGGIALAKRLGARLAKPDVTSEKVYINVVQELCISARMPVPAIMVKDRGEQINALAAGWERGDRAVVVTAQAIAQLSRDELQAVMAHELSHIREGDTYLNMQLAAMVYGLQMIFGYGRSLAGTELVLLRVFGGLVMYAGLVGWFAGCLLQAAISRQREFLADARAVEWTRQTDGLTGALEKIDAQAMPSFQARMVMDDLELMGNRTECSAISHLWMAPPLDTLNLFGQWLDSHPSVDERLRRLRRTISF